MKGEVNRVSEYSRHDADPHAGQSIVKAGAPLETATAAIVALHGRGSSTDDILALAHAVGPRAFVRLAPQAAGRTWYPNPFLAPIPSNEPFLSSALASVGRAVVQATSAGIPHERIVLLGFSQGACLALEYAARHARRWGAVVGFTGGLIGPPGTNWNYSGSFSGTPVFLGCSDIDAHIPIDRVYETAEVLRGLGGAVDLRIYPGMAHTVNRDELDAVRSILKSLESAA